MREDLQSERCQYVQDLELRLRDQEVEKQLEVGGDVWAPAPGAEGWGWVEDPVAVPCSGTATTEVLNARTPST